VIQELNDLIAVLQMLSSEGEIKKLLMDIDLIKKKKLKVEEYLKYSQKLGVVE